MFLFMPAIGSLAFSPTALFASHPTLVYEMVGHAVGHFLFKFSKRTRKRRGLSRAQMRKAVNRKRRQFVDNIIMHHQRLANLNRETIANNARERAIARREKIKKKFDARERGGERDRDAGKGFSFSRERQDPRQKYKSNTDLRERGKQLRGMTDAKRIRARSKWLTLMAQKN